MNVLLVEIQRSVVGSVLFIIAVNDTEEKLFYSLQAKHKFRVTDRKNSQKGPSTLNSI